MLMDLLLVVLLFVTNLSYTLDLVKIKYNTHVLYMDNMKVKNVTHYIFVTGVALMGATSHYVFFMKIG